MFETERKSIKYCRTNKIISTFFIFSAWFLLFYGKNAEFFAITMAKKQINP